MAIGLGSESVGGAEECDLQIQVHVRGHLFFLDAEE